MSGILGQKRGDAFKRTQKEREEEGELIFELLRRSLLSQLLLSSSSIFFKMRYFLFFTI